MSNPRKRPARIMPYSIKEHPEHEGAVSLMRSASVATQWEFAELWRRFPDELMRGLQGFLITDRGASFLAGLARTSPNRETDNEGS